MIYEKDNVLNEALEYIVAVRFEGQNVNKDFLGYWSIMSDNIFNISTASFRAGLEGFYKRLKDSPDARELMGYHIRLMTVLVNNNAVIMAADELFTILAHNLRDEVDNDVVFDLVKGKEGELHMLSGFEKVLLLLHIYQDRIDCALSSIMTPPTKSGPNKERKFRP